MKIIRSCLALFILVCQSGQPSFPVHAEPNATTLYVDGLIAGQGHCTNYNPSTRSCGSGSATAYATIAGAAAQVQAGDTVFIQPGMYTGGITVDTSGTAIAPITFQADSAGVVINGSGGDRDAFFITEADYIVVEGLTIQNANRAGLRISMSNHITVRNCIFANNGTWGLFTDFSDYTTVENSEAYGSVNEHGIYISNSSDYPTLRGNRLHHNRGCGLHMNGDISMGGDGVISHALVERNIIYENGLGGGSGINMDGVTDSVIRNNLLYNNRASGISLYQIDGGSGSQNNRVLNNTIVMPSNGRWAINIPNTNDTNNKLFNNIILNHHSYRGSIVIASPTLAGFESDYNVMMDRFSTDGEGDTRVTLAQWQALGYDQHSFVATSNQLFIDPTSGNYHLKDGSLAIDQGTSLIDVPADLDGNPRPSGFGYDIGAYEFIPAIILNGIPGNQTIHLGWEVNTALPVTSTWKIAYLGLPGDQSSPITGIANSTRTYTLTGLTNYQWYTVTLNAVIDSTPALTDTVNLMPTNILVYLPLVLKE